MLPFLILEFKKKFQIFRQNFVLKWHFNNVPPSMNTIIAISTSVTCGFPVFQFQVHAKFHIPSLQSPLESIASKTCRLDIPETWMALPFCQHFRDEFPCRELFWYNAHSDEEMNPMSAMSKFHAILITHTQIKLRQKSNTLKIKINLSTKGTNTKVQSQVQKNKI